MIGQPQNSTRNGVSAAELRELQRGSNKYINSANGLGSRIISSGKTATPPERIESHLTTIDNSNDQKAAVKTANITDHVYYAAPSPL